MFTIAFTGKRPKQLHGYNSYKEYEPLVSQIKHKLKKYADIAKKKNEPLKIVTGGAQGIDQLAFWAANNLKTQGYDIIQHVCIPFTRQPSQWRTTGPFGQEDYYKMLALADDITNLEDLHDANIYALYNIRNAYMIDMADMVIAIALESDCLNGGTGNAVKYTLQKSKIIQGIDPFTLQDYQIGE